MPANAVKSRRRTIDEKIDQIVGANLRTLRTRRGWSQTALAQELGITFQQVQKYENGSNRISASTLYVLSKTLDVSIMDFFTGTDTSEPATLITPEQAELLRLYAALPSYKARLGVKKLLKQWTSVTK